VSAPHQAPLSVPRSGSIDVIFNLDPDFVSKNIELSQTYTNEFAKKANSKYK